MTAQIENKPEPKTEQVQTAQAAPQAQVIATPEAAPPIKSEENQANWKAFREQKAQERKAREEAERKAAEEAQRAEAYRIALEAAVNKPSNNRQINEYGSDTTEESEEQRIERKVQQSINKYRQEEERLRKEREAQELPYQLQRAFPDVEKVISDENLDYLRFHYPEIAQSLDYTPKTFDGYATVYKTLKRLVPNQADAKHDAQKIEKNLNKPGSVSSTGQSGAGTGAAGNAVRLTEERRAANWARMQRTMNLLKD